MFIRGLPTSAGGSVPSTVDHATTFSVDDAVTNTYTDIITLKHTSTGTATTSFAASILFQLENAAGTTIDAARLRVEWSDATAGSEDADYVFSTRQAGSLIDMIRFTPITNAIQLLATGKIRFGSAIATVPMIKQEPISGLRLQVRTGDDSAFAPLDARGDSKFYITAGTTQTFEVRTPGDAKFSITEWGVRCFAAGAQTFQTGNMRMDETSQAGIRVGFGRQMDGTSGTDTFSPSTAINRTHVSFESVFSPSASSPSYAGIQILSTINGTSSGKAGVLAVVGKTMTLTGGTKRLISAGVSTTDWYTGFTEHLFLNDAGLMQLGSGADASAVSSPTNHFFVQGSGKQAVTARNTSLDIEIGFWVQGDANGRMGTFTNHVLQLYVNNDPKWQIDTSGNLAQVNAGETITATRFITAGSTTAAYDHADSTVGVGSASTGRVRYSSTSNTLQASLNGAAYVDIATSDLYVKQLVAYKTADETITNTTLQNDDHLTVSLAASSKYYFEIELFTDNAGATEGFKAALNGTVGVTSLKAQISLYDDTTNTLAGFGRVTALGSSVGAGLGAGVNYNIITGTIETSTAGTFLVQWAQNATGASAGVTVQRNSAMVVTKVG